MVASRQLLKAFLIVLAVVGFIAICGRAAHAAELPIVDVVCDFLENEWLRWLAGCPPLDSGAH
jgi:hypothetical protein